MNSWDIFNYVLGSVEDALYSSLISDSEFDPLVSKASIDFGNKESEITIKIKVYKKDQGRTKKE